MRDGDASERGKSGRVVLIAGLVVAATVVGAVGFAGTGAAISPFARLEVLGGAAGQDLANAGGPAGPFLIDESTVDEFGTSGSVRVELSGDVTFDAAGSSPGSIVVSDGTRGTTSGATLADGQTLTFDYGGLDAAAQDNFSLQDLAVDVGQTTDGNVTVSVSPDGQSPTNRTFTLAVKTPTASGGGVAIEAGSSAVPLDPLVVETPALNGSIAAGSTLTVRTNRSAGVTFDAGSTSLEATYADTNGRLDVRNATVESDRVLVPVNRTFDFGGDLKGQVTIDGLRVDAASDADATRLVVETVPVGAIAGVTVASPSRDDVVIRSADVTGASTSTVVGVPATAGRDAVHTVTVRVGNDTGGELFDRLVVDYGVGSTPADVSNVAFGDVFAVTVDGTDVTGSLTTVSVSGDVLTLDFDGTVLLERDDALVVQYRDVVNPATAATTDVRIAVNPTTAPVDESTATLTTIDSPVVEVSNLQGPARLAFGERLNATADVTNTGASTTGADAEFRVDRDRDGVLAADETFATRQLDGLAGGETRQVVFNASTGAFGLPDENGAYVYGVVVDNGSDVAVFDLGTTENPFPSGVPGTGSRNPPTNADGDPQLEDVDGSGAFDFLDVIALLFADFGEINRTNPTGADLLDFDGSGKLDFLDVVTLLFEL